MTITKKAIQLETGDRIVRQGHFPQSIYCGVVRSTVVVDRGVQINLEPSGHYTRPEDELFEVER